MQTTSLSTERDSRLIDLMRDLPREVKLLVKQEMELAKAEMTEKLNHFKAHTITLIIGGAVAAVGLMLFMLGLGFIAAFGFAALGLPLRVADFLGFATVGLLLGGGGYGLIRHSLNTLAEESLKPEKTIETIKHEQILSATVHPRAIKPTTNGHSNGKRASEELAARVNRTQIHMHDTLLEIQRRLKPRYLFGTALPQQIKGHPIGSAMVGLASGLLGFLYLRRNHRKTC
jgi:hypothetical protein